MNYKKIIKSRNLRNKILNILSFIPDKVMLKIQYRIKFGRKLNLKNPQRFTEKLQWYKINYRNQIMPKCVDKYDVRNYVKECGLGNILNECYGVYDNPNNIDFEGLPDQFVLKDTLGGGGNSVIICKDKSKFNKNECIKILNNWVNTKVKRNGGREWPYYSGKKHRIIIEKYIKSDLQNGGLIDYKFFCFDGNVKFVYGISDRKMGEKASLGIFDKNFNLLPYYRADEKKLERNLEKPINYDKMVEYAELLGKKFPHARIDFYNVNGKIIFGEITFFDGSGYMKFEPDEFDFILGSKFNIS